ncbi:MAG: hypothetical protein EBW96_05025, partial [Actinobacteria bacterium]|nr:hypothetical protein [Actinomycetota bacterium]
MRTVRSVERSRIADFPQTQPVCRGNWRCVLAATRTNESHHVARRASTKTDVNERAHQRTHHLVTKRVGAHLKLDEVARAIDCGVKAVVVTHLYGLAISDIEAIADLCRRKKIPLIEDCAQAHGAKLAGRRVGTFGDVASFSFYPTKNLGALGDGGAVVTSNEEFAARVKLL